MIKVSLNRLSLKYPAILLLGLVYLCCVVCSWVAHSWEQGNPRHTPPGTLLTTSSLHAMLSPHYCSVLFS